MTTRMVILESIQNEKATINDYEINKSFEVSLTEEEMPIYQSMLDEAKEEELENEDIGVFVFYNTDKDRLEFK